jgi:Transposase IS4
LLWSGQPREKPEGLSWEKYRWMLVDDHVKRFNEHRQRHFFPSEHLCVDESITRWYGQGGHWINLRLPMYIAIDRKPENGCKIQNAACGESGVMIRLKLVKTAEEEATSSRPTTGMTESIIPSLACLLLILGLFTASAPKQKKTKESSTSTWLAR